VGSGGASSTATLLIENSANSNTGYGAQIAFSNYSTSPMSLGSIACLRENNAANWSSSMVLSTAVNGVTTEQMRITSSGNVGIGTTTPGYPLTVQASAAGTTAAFFGSGAFDASNIVRIQNQASQYGRNQLVLTGRYEGSNDAWSFNGARNCIQFWTQSSLNSAQTQRYTIQNFADNLGIMSAGMGDTPVIRWDNAGNTVFNGGVIMNVVPQNDYQWGGTRSLCLGSNNQVQFGSSACRNVALDLGAGWWTSGYNYTYAFYRNNGRVSVHITGKYSGYTSGAGMTYANLRVYEQNTGNVWYFDLRACQNLGGEHTTYPIDCVFNDNHSLNSGWYDIYFYSSGGFISDNNDQLIINIQTSNGSQW
jgi:hypothetical protein